MPAANKSDRNVSDASEPDPDPGADQSSEAVFGVCDCDFCGRPVCNNCSLDNGGGGVDCCCGMLGCPSPAQLVLIGRHSLIQILI